MSDREFEPEEDLSLIFHPGAYVREINGRETNLRDFKVEEVVKLMAIKTNRFFVEEKR